MVKKIIQLQDVSPEEYKKEIVTGVVEEVKKEIQLFTDNFKPQTHLKFIDSKEACKILGITLPTLFDWRKRKIVPFYQIANKIRFKLSDIENSVTRNNQD